MTKEIGIIGNGFVGNATLQLKCNNIDVLAYDLNPKLCIPPNMKFIDLLVIQYSQKKSIKCN